MPGAIRRRHHECATSSRAAHGGRRIGETRIAQPGPVAGAATRGRGADAGSRHTRASSPRQRQAAAAPGTAAARSRSRTGTKPPMKTCAHRSPTGASSATCGYLPAPSAQAAAVGRECHVAGIGVSMMDSVQFTGLRRSLRRGRTGCSTRSTTTRRNIDGRHSHVHRHALFGTTTLIPDSSMPSTNLPDVAVEQAEGPVSGRAPRSRI